jgi:hypothetical protein
VSGEARSKYAQPPAAQSVKQQADDLQQKKIQVATSTPQQRAQQIATPMQEP